MDDIDNLYIEAEQVKQATKLKRGYKSNTKHIKVRNNVEAAKDNYKAAKQMHNKAIWSAWLTYRGQVWRAWRTYRNTKKQHKLLIKQAHNTYKIIKLSSK